MLYAAALLVACNLNACAAALGFYSMECVWHRLLRHA
jgi:hypothetical protein